MSNTPGKGRPTGIPTPGKASSIPTPELSPTPSRLMILPSTVSVMLLLHPSLPHLPCIRIRQAVGLWQAVLLLSLLPPLLRQSDVFARSTSRAGKTFDLGENIDGKPGHWAGVELSGGFSGKGKNDGTVNGKQYFRCSPNCGVFVATTKLSAPTVGHLPMSRPSSVASSRGGRVTPSLTGRTTPSASSSASNGRRTPSISVTNGRITPSLSKGRVTPSASVGRKTPGLPTPTARARSVASYSTVSTMTPVRNVPAQSITPGSRASKYVGMTAKQLSSRGTGALSPSQMSTGTSSPTRATGFGSIQTARSVPSPTRTFSASPYQTPKAMTSARTSNVGIGLPPTSTTPSKSRSTPRPRVSSSIAMPPPPSPSPKSLSNRSISLNDPVPLSEGHLSDLEQNGRALQEKLADLFSGMTTSSPRPDSSASTGSSNVPELHGQVDRLQSRLDTLEDENQRLRAATNAAEEEASRQIERLVSERDQNAARIAELEGLIRTTERAVNERETAIESLERAAQQTALDIEKVRIEGEARWLKRRKAFKRRTTQCSRPKMLRLRYLKLVFIRPMRSSKRIGGMGDQVDELRKAGQETIALYEERLSAADSRRYELEDLVASLEEQLRTQTVPPSPAILARQAASAAEIDNETLRDQVQHLQKKIATLEDHLEDAHVTAEKEEAAVGERIKRYKEREDSIRQELSDSHSEMERLLKSEEHARQRVEEMEEALRENTVALENARAEVETLRNEIADLESIASDPANKSSERLTELAQRSSGERARLVEEIAQLKEQLAETQSRDGPAAIEAQKTIQELNEYVNLLQSDSQTLQQLCEERQTELANERNTVADLRLLMDERSAELDMMRKKLNRDLPVNGLESMKTPVSPSKHELSAARDEITGLKHIVQELQKENSAATQRSKLLENENKLLREDLKVLEENVEQSILREEQALLSGDETPTTPVSDDVQALRQSFREQKARYEVEVEQQRKKLMDAEMKNARTVHDLTKEIGELETLIESKIYREDELETEVERLKEKLARSQKKLARAELGLSTAEPTRIIIRGYPTLKGRTLLEKRTYAREKVDHIRQRLMREPRGHAEMYGAILVPETELTASGKADIGVLFCHNEGYSTMCGQATIALGRFLVDTQDEAVFPRRRQLVHDKENGVAELRLHVPCGVVDVKVPTIKDTETGRVRSDGTRRVKFVSVPSFASALNVEIAIPPEMRWKQLKKLDVGRVRVDVGFGGAYYAIVTAQGLGFTKGLRSGEYTLRDLDEATATVRKIICGRRGLFEHPREKELEYLYGVIVVEEVTELGVCFFADQQIDRSPTGSGVSARVAVAITKGSLGLARPVQFHSLVSLADEAENKSGGFIGTGVEKAKLVGGNGREWEAVRVAVEGLAYYTGAHSFFVEDALSRDGIVVQLPVMEM
ncbi:Trans-L-3-hydroxyproline dehydratase [Grifola frondosa]|uniref:trans-L-3-hydroxyproline dehydratase n=1 Tax=Grifola frondosa TaxID=5627 RepID=A0A1C7LU31_GRIFR|nr:Trans-L-3-hydroxyproline dehydratase [Grifola frondosa]